MPVVDKNSELLRLSSSFSSLSHQTDSYSFNGVSISESTACQVDIGGFYSFFQARTFNDTPINPRRCCHILTKILYLLNQASHSFLQKSDSPSEFSLGTVQIHSLISILRIIYSYKILFVQGEHIGTTEATEAFFAMTKLFQSKDVSSPVCVYVQAFTVIYTIYTLI